MRAFESESASAIAGSVSGVTIPKSMIFGPASSSITLAGFTSRCTTPAAWMAVKALAMPRAISRVSAADSGPVSVTSSSSAGPGT